MKHRTKEHDDWITPKDFYDELNKEFRFNFDPCPTNPQFDGLSYQKATDIWTNCSSWNPRVMCKPNSPCHVRSPRGSKTGIQGLGNDNVRGNLVHPDWNYSVSRSATKRGIVPVDLCNEILGVCESL